MVDIVALLITFSYEIRPKLSKVLESTTFILFIVLLRVIKLKVKNTSQFVQYTVSVCIYPLYTWKST